MQAPLARARTRADGQIARKCDGVTPDDINRPCDISATSTAETIACVLDQHFISVQEMIAAEYRDACAMAAPALPAVCNP